MNLIFDIDGTLWDTTEIVAGAWNDAIIDVGLGDKLGRFITADMLKQEFGRPMDVIVDDLFPGQPDDIKARIQERVKYHEQIAVGGCSDDLTYPGMRDTMHRLAGENRLYIVSNCQDGYIDLVMDKTGIREYITDYECFGATGFTKPDNIRLLCERNGIDVADAVYIGDTAGDYESASAAGCGFIYAAYGFGGDVPVDGYSGRKIDSLEELGR